MRQQPNHSYAQILTSSVWMGGTSLITVLAALLRTKVLAVFLGPAGIGFIGLLTSLTSMVGALSGMGISTSGVLKIADAAGAGEEIRVARTVRAVRQIVLWLGLLGALLLAAFCVPLSRLTFGTAEHAGKIALLSLVIVFGAVAERQMAVLQGLRRMSDLGKLTILSTTVSAVLTLPIVYFWPQHAVVALLLVASGAGMAASWCMREGSRSRRFQ